MKLEKRGGERERERLSYVSTFFDCVRVWVCHVTGILILAFVVCRRLSGAPWNVELQRLIH